MKKWKLKAVIEDQSNKYQELDEMTTVRINDLSAQRDALHLQNKELTDSCTDLRRLCEEARSIMTKQDQELDRLRAALNSSKLQFSKLSAVTGSLRECLDHAKEEVKALKKMGVELMLKKKDTLESGELRGAGEVVMVPVKRYWELRAAEVGSLRK